MPELKRWLAERFFEDQLEEDFRMGIRHGQGLARAEARFKLETSKPAAYKKNQPGVALAIEALK